jgi:putative ABC transport system ATP-binding protein
MSSLIQLKQVRKVYKQGDQTFEALRGIDLEIKRGEFVAIMGPSGSGKSTLMNILGALDVPSSGHYHINGEDISKYKADELSEFRNRDVGFVFQQFNLLPRTSVRDNVLLPTLYGKLLNKEERFHEVIRKVGLADKVNNKPNQLSGGQIQRVAIARALIMQPAIIMADEPTGNLDSKTAHEVMDIFTQINKEGNTIILVTHEADIAEYAKRIIRIKDGVIIEDKQK